MFENFWIVLDWGSPRIDAQGRILERWAAKLDFHIANVDSVSTCMRHNGESIADLPRGRTQVAIVEGGNGVGLPVEPFL